MHNIFRTEIAILGAARTPVGKFDGCLKDFMAVDLGGIAIAEAVRRAGVSPADVRAVSMGSVVSSGFGASPAKQAALKGGLTPYVHSRVVECVCGSSVDALAITAESIVAGGPDLCVAGGMESRSNAPYLLGPRLTRKTPNYDRGSRLSVKRAGAYRFALSENIEEQLGATEMKDATTYDSLFWPPDKKFMRDHALMYVKRSGYTLEQINALSADSYLKARRATAEGWFADEIADCGDAATDDIPDAGKVEALRSASGDDFASGFNSSGPADCGSAVVVTSGERARSLGLKPIAWIRGYARVDGPPTDYLGQPVAASIELLDAMRAAGHDIGWEVAEANEAFGIQLPLYFENFPGAIINPHGGAIAMGHPLGAAGTRLVTTLIYSLRRYQKRWGLMCTCFGGGGGYAVAIENAL